MDYQAYLASREWALKREAVRKRSGNQCEREVEGLRCRRPHESTHHKTYERVGHEDLEDLMAVCNPCHKWLSGKTRIDPFDRERVRVFEGIKWVWERQYGKACDIDLDSWIDYVAEVQQFAIDRFESRNQAQLIEYFKKLGLWR